MEYYRLKCNTVKALHNSGDSNPGTGGLPGGVENARMFSRQQLAAVFITNKFVEPFNGNTIVESLLGHFHGTNIVFFF
ncbi:hypothetical protein [Chitinophaga sp. Cy-1792]|uniref:hypothetical protein n=1 Tax=Chitinophaga sp. Cy-1792 TaxID=2608339 RepID=UPI001420761F|nr:hypothetical protein [Chitinophaga sp. Cy-1792]NIG55993.1 hypothetical protein [Chitinophaga sp. Cy-1792]